MGEKPIRVLQVVTKMQRAGLESRLMDIYRHIDRTQIQFDFYTCRKEEGIFDKEIQALGGRVYYGEPLSLKNVFSISKRFEDFCKDHQEYKIVHCHLNQWCGIILKGACRAGVPARIAHSRTSLEKFSVKNLVKNFIKIPTNKFATHCFAVSVKAGTWLFGKKAIQENRVRILPNAIDCHSFQFNALCRAEVRNALNVEDCFVLINVGNLRIEKNQSFLLRVLHDLSEDLAGIKMIFVGDGELKDHLKNESKRLGVEENTVFLGSRSDVSDILQAADLFVFPSLYEGFPGAVLEAEANGLSCIVSDRITTEVCINKNVLRLSIDDAHEWAEAIKKERLMQAKQNTSRKDAVEEQINQYDIHRLVEILVDFYLSFYR